jgi:beta-lactamase class A
MGVRASLLKGRVLVSLSVLCLAAPPLIPAAGAYASQAPAAATRLEAAFATLAKQTDGTVGVAVQRIGGGPVYTLNAGQTFPMASTFKIAVAGAVLNRIDKGELKLDTMVTVDPAVWVQSAGITEQMKHPGVALSVHNLLELMLTRSDNTATDVMVAQAGGPAAVTAWLTKVGVTKGQRVDADTARLIYRALDITPGPGSFKDNIERAFAADPSKRDMDQKRTPNIPFNNDPRDASTPEAMVQLLAVIQSGKALSASSTKVLIEIMERCITGEKRLKGLLPQGTVVAHKTGTLMSIANDVGIVTMPDGSKFAIAVFVKSDTKGIDTQERVIAEIARTAYDHYLLGGQ